MNKLHTTIISTITALLLFAGVASAQAVDEIVYFHPDALGSATAAYNEAGEECWSQDYTPYGEKIDPLDGFPPSGCGLLGSERGYTGHVQDTTGLVYMQQRYYDPTLMRFLSIDPVGVNSEESKTFNRYAYAVNNPYRYVDPDGRFAFLAVLAPFAPALGQGSIGVVAGHFAGVAGMTGLILGAQAIYNESSDDSSRPDQSDPKIHPQKQKEHIKGTSSHKNRSKQAREEGRGIDPSTWDNPEEADELTIDTWKTGTIDPRNPNQKTKEYGRRVGTNPNTGKGESGVRTHENAKGLVHGHPFGEDRSKREE